MPRLRVYTHRRHSYKDMIRASKGKRGLKMSNQTIKERYSCKGTALAAANYLRVFGFDAEAKFLNGIWRVVIHETEGDYWHREV